MSPTEWRPAVARHSRRFRDAGRRPIGANFGVRVVSRRGRLEAADLAVAQAVVTAAPVPPPTPRRRLAENIEPVGFEQRPRARREPGVVIDDEDSPGRDGIVGRLRAGDYSASVAQTASNTDVSPSKNASRNGCCPARKSSEPSAPKTTRPVLVRTFWCVTGSV
jgi:hypothetical protein